MEIDDEIKIRRPREIVLDQIQFKKRISVGQNIFEYPEKGLPYKKVNNSNTDCVYSIFNL